MEQCAKSNIFKLPNPWLMAVLHLMVELYQFAELKLNLKFKIEVLFKGLDVELKEQQHQATVQMQLQQQRQHQQQLSQQPATNIAQGLERLSIAGGYGTAADGRMVSQVTIDRAICEIIVPVIKRSVTIASISTCKLVTKDFAMEGDKEKMQASARQMAQNLASSLVLVKSLFTNKSTYSSKEQEQLAMIRDNVDTLTNGIGNTP
ncbi:uncharacterized protein UBRO2_05915 [Ustilago bromivora]|uniref:Uncharacterized protein n=1 Tax=Ustilago bromivora TaxID=307758 RepID=A0A8H8QSV7_9BASI|nr:uncharacterized protein UBRO2_05915 [Ustilago bromivora]